MIKKISTVLIIFLFCPILAGHFTPNVKAGEIEDIKARLKILEQKMGIVSNKLPIVESDIDFNWIMNSLSKLDEIDNGNGNPFNFHKDGDGGWEIEHTENGTTSPVLSLGGKEIEMVEFPSNWWMNGTWVFSIEDKDCQLMHKIEQRAMEWECG